MRKRWEESKAEVRHLLGFLTLIQPVDLQSYNSPHSKLQPSGAALFLCSLANCF